MGLDVFWGEAVIMRDTKERSRGTKLIGDLKDGKEKATKVLQRQKTYDEAVVFLIFFYSKIVLLIFLWRHPVATFPLPSRRWSGGGGVDIELESDPLPLLS